jgi:hypothetical protein
LTKHDLEAKLTDFQHRTRGAGLRQPQAADTQDVVIASHPDIHIENERVSLPPHSVAITTDAA